MKHSYRLPLLIALAAAQLGLSAQTIRESIAETPEKLGGVYYAYPVTQAVSTPAPKGYEPFYISHYGRHGSRYLISEDDYTTPLEVLRKADRNNVLTQKGKETLAKLTSIAEEAKGRGGELSPLGVRQHAAIAGRMYDNYPQVFSGNADITAVSTQVMRCAHSMFSFIEALKERNPSLVIPRESGKREMSYLCYWTQESADYNGKNGNWRPDYLEFKKNHTRPDSLMSRLFSDPGYVRLNIVPDELMWSLYWVAVSQQNIEDKSDLTDIFSFDELYDLWLTTNLAFYVHNASYPRANGLHVDNAKNLLRHITENADRYIAEGKHGATLRFGHDGNITPLLALMKVENCHGSEENPDKVCEAWQNYYVSPMASNIQLVFFKNSKKPENPILVKILHNEKEVHIPVKTDIFPFYRWDDVRVFFDRMLTTPFAKTLNDDVASN